MGNDFNKFHALVDQARGEVEELTVEEVRVRLDSEESVHLIDVRERDEWDRGHIPGASHLSKGVLERDIEKMVPGVDLEIILYCGGGSRSMLAARSLQKMGYKKVYSLRGGVSAWKQASLPLIKD